MQLQLSPGAPTLKPLCPTRWTVRTAAFASVLYTKLRSALFYPEEIHSSGTDEYAIKATDFLSMMEKVNIFFGLKLSHLIFSAEDTTIQEKWINSLTISCDIYFLLSNQDFKPSQSSLRSINNCTRFPSSS